MKQKIPAPRARKSATHPTLRYGLIGTGTMGHGHIGALKEFSEVGVVAIADSFAESRRQAIQTLGRNVPAYADYHDMLAKEDLDAVVIATPNCTHAPIVCEALAAGVHVLGEKPMSSTLDGCNRILKAARRADTIYQVGLELRYVALWQKVHSLIREGRIGRVRQLWCKEFRGPWARKVGQWITQKSQSGGALVEKNCHHLDLFNWFVGRGPVSVAGFGSCDLVYGAEHFAGVTPDVLDNAQVLVNYGDGVVAALLLCMYCPGYREGLEMGIIGTEGWLLANSHPEDVLRLSNREGTETITLKFALPAPLRQISHDGAVYLEHRAFLENIRTQQRPLTDAAVAWWATAVPIAAERAIAEGRIVAMEELGPAPQVCPC